MPGDADAERIDRALVEFGCGCDHDRTMETMKLECKRCRREILEQLLAERAVVPGGSALVEAKREVQSLRRDLAVAQQRLAELEKVLEPFATAADLIDEQLSKPSDDLVLYFTTDVCRGCIAVQMKNLRAARALLSPEAKP